MALGELTAISMFRDLPAPTLQRLERGSRTTTFRNGASVFVQGDPADAIYAILAGPGHVRIGSINPRAKMLMVETFGAGDLFGEIGVLDGGARSADAIVEGPVRLLRISAPAFLAMLDETPTLATSLARTLATRLRRTFILLQDATFERLEIRLARQLLYLAERESRETPAGLQIAGRFRQADLANLLGTTPRSIITILNAWREARLVDYEPGSARLTILDPSRLGDILRGADVNG